MTKDITVFEKEIDPIASEAEVLTIVTQEDMAGAVTLLSNLNRSLDKITEEKEKVTKPLNEALKAERGRWKPFETKLESAISTIRSKMSSYQTESARLAKIEEEKIAARIAPGKGNLSMETATKKIDEIERADKSVATDAGLVKFRTDKKLKITDALIIPREYLVVDEKAVFEALKKGAAIPGAEIEEVQTPVNIR